MSSQPAPPPAAPRDAPVERRVFRMLALLALVAVCFAVVLNYVFAPERVAQRQVGAVGTGVATQYQPEVLHLPQPAMELIPEVILAYETMTRQGIPGQVEQAAEAIYATLSMDVEMQLPTNVYMRVEGFATEEEAKQRVAVLMEPYTYLAGNGAANDITVTRVGFNPTDGAYAQSWTRGQYTVFIKASYLDKPPVFGENGETVSPQAKTVKLLVTQSQIVTNAVDTYQRTGQQGISGGRQGAAGEQPDTTTSSG